MHNQRDRSYDIIDTGLDAARKFKYLSQQTNSRIICPLPIERIQCKKFYEKHQKAFDNFVKLFKKYSFNMNEYLEFFVLSRFKHEKDIDRSLLDISMIQQHIEDKQIKHQRKQILKNLKQSAVNIAKECVQDGYPRSIDFFKDLISTKRLAAYYMSGIISKHFFAAIPRFPSIVQKLDPISRDEFSLLCSKFEKYSVDIHEAMLQGHFHYSNVFDYTDSLIDMIKKQDSKV